MSKGVRGSLLGVAAAAVIALFTGCGNSGNSGLSKAEFTQQAKVVCNEWQSEKEESIHKVINQLSHGTVKRADQEQAVFAVLAPYEEAIEKMEGLGAPEGEEKKVEAILAAMNGAVERVKANPGTALVSSIPFKQANELLANYGLEGCEA